MDYSKSKFDSATSEACYTLANHGTGHDFTDGAGRNHMLVDYSPVLLMNVEADADLIARLRAETNSMSGTGWITEDTDGNVSVRMAALSGFDRPVVDGFEAAQQAEEYHERLRLAGECEECRNLPTEPDPYETD